MTPLTALNSTSAKIQMFNIGDLDLTVKETLNSTSAKIQISSRLMCIQYEPSFKFHFC